MIQRKAVTAMNTLAAIGPDLSEMPRFDDGMVNIRELIRTMAEALVNEIMDAQAEDACADGNQRNGYRDRALVTSVGVINLRIPKLRRGSYFPEDLLVRYSRVDRAVVAAVSEMVTCGVSTRKVEKVASALGADRMGASQVLSCVRAGHGDRGQVGRLPAGFRPGRRRRQRLGHYQTIGSASNPLDQ